MWWASTGYFEVGGINRWGSCQKSNIRLEKARNGFTQKFLRIVSVDSGNEAVNTAAALDRVVNDNSVWSARNWTFPSVYSTASSWKELPAVKYRFCFYSTTNHPNTEHGLKKAACNRRLVLASMDLSIQQAATRSCTPFGEIKLDPL